MKTRFFSGAVLALLVLSAMLLGGYVLKAVLYFCIAFCTYEVYTAFKQTNIHISRLVCIEFVVALPLFITFFGVKGILVHFMITGLLILVVKVFRADLTMENTAYSFFTLFYPCMLMAVLPLMMTLPGEGGRASITFTLLIASVTDVACYFVGSMFGKHKLCPAISPKKTVEGAFGGVIGGTLTGIIMYFLVPLLFKIELPLWSTLVVSLVCSVVSQFGDLAASIIKRSTGIKDFGKIIPGHGGLMDRADSIMFVAPVVYFFFSVIVFSV